MAQTRISIALALIGLLTAFAVATFFAALIWPFGCGGDGGVPYAARASPAGEYCASSTGEQTQSGLVSLILFPIFGVLVIGIISIIRAVWKPLLYSALAGFVGLALMVAPMIVLDSECTEEQKATLSRRECESY